MLVMTRRPQERIMIGEGIVVTLIAINGQQARIAVSAPANTPVHREEVYLRIKAGEERPQQGDK